MVAKYSEWTRGQDEALLNKLGGMEVALRLLNCREVNVEFRDGETVAAIAAITSGIEVWKSITVGTIPQSQLGTKIIELGINVSKWAADMMKQKAFVVATAQEQVNFARRSPADLGFKEGARYDAICARAIKMGYELCQPEDGPQLRLQYLDQPKGEWLVIVMEPIRDSFGYLCIFDVGHDGGGLYLRSYYGEPVRFFVPGAQLVFRRKPSDLQPLGSL